jgi:hypothetical protein
MVRTKQLTGVALAHYVGQMCLLLRKLREEDRTISYEEAGRAIGFIAEDECWMQRQQYQIGRILDATVAVNRYTTVQELTHADVARVINTRGSPRQHRLSRPDGRT